MFMREEPYVMSVVGSFVLNYISRSAFSRGFFPCSHLTSAITSGGRRLINVHSGPTFRHAAPR